jgi:hypothetical protein
VATRVNRLLLAIDSAALRVFTIEIGLKICLYRSRFFRGGWNIFDFAINARRRGCLVQSFTRYGFNPGGIDAGLLHRGGHGDKPFRRE